MPVIRGTLLDMSACRMRPIQRHHALHRHPDERRSASVAASGVAVGSTVPAVIVRHARSSC